MKIRIGTNPAPRVRNTSATVAMMVLLVALFISVSVANAQSESSQAQVTTIVLEPNQIAQVRTAQKISTRVSFSEPVKAVICGDLYDPATGIGSFVIQSIGNDVFVKPVGASGSSNMFVKTGENREHTYNFSLEIYPVKQAHMVINVQNAVSKIVLAGNQPLQPGPSRFRPPIPVRFGTTVASIDRLDLTTSGFAERMLAGGGLGAQPPTGMEQLPAPPPPTMTSIKASRLSPTTANNNADIPGDPVKKVNATYPDFGWRLGPTGVVEVEVMVDEGGKVISAKALSGHIMLREAAITAARGWRFNPTTVNGAAVRVARRITFDFKRPPDRGFTMMDAGVSGRWRR